MSGTNPVHADASPSAWVQRWLGLVRPGGTVLDLACGRGRHARLAAGLGFDVVAVDRDRDALAMLADVPGITARATDLEGAPWPFDGAAFDAIIVANYLHRPLLPRLAAALAPRGVLVYETFMVGNERHGRPSNPDFLLRAGELPEALGPHLVMVAFEQGEVNAPRPAVVQRYCGARGGPERPLPPA